MRNTNKYIDIRNEKAINHFLNSGASLTIGVKCRVIHGKMTDMDSLVAFVSGGEFDSMSGVKFNRYLVKNDLLLK